MDTAELEHDARLIADILAHPARAAHAIGALMKNLSELIAAQATLIADRQDAVQRAEAAEAENATLTSQLTALQQQIASDEATAGDALAKVQAEISAEEGTGSGGAGATSVNDVVAQVVPNADPSHIAAAVDAHDAAMTSGATPADQVAAANAAAVQAGADPVTAAAIANAITQPTGGTTASAVTGGKTILADGTQV